MRRPPSQWRSAIRWPANWEQKRWKAQEREGGRGECYQSGGAGGGGRRSRGPFESNLPSGPRKRSDPGGEASVDHFGEFPALLRGEGAVVGDRGKRDAHSLGASVAGVDGPPSDRRQSEQGAGDRVESTEDRRAGRSVSGAVGAGGPGVAQSGARAQPGGAASLGGGARPGRLGQSADDADQSGPRDGEVVWRPAVRVLDEEFAREASKALPQELKAALEPLLEVIADLSERIRGLDRDVEAWAQRFPVTERLRQIKGVGALTALVFVLTLDDPHRFARSRSVGAYLGLVPASRSSGNSRPQLPITKQGDRLLRRLLVQASHYILGPFGQDSDLRSFGLELSQRGGKNGKKRAVVAVARKLAVLLHRLWVSGEDYEPHRRPVVEIAA